MTSSSRLEMLSLCAACWSQHDGEEALLSSSLLSGANVVGVDGLSMLLSRGTVMDTEYGERVLQRDGDRNEGECKEARDTWTVSP